MKSFNTFLGNKKREDKEKLNIIRNILEKSGFTVNNHILDPKEPYLYVRKPTDVIPQLESLSFGGVRIYNRGKDIICYRCQNKEDTQPYGTTYQLDIEGIFKSLIKEENKDLIGYKIIFQIIKELKEFFVNSLDAEKESEKNDSPMGNVVIGNSMGTDYSNTVMNTRTS